MGDKKKKHTHTKSKPFRTKKSRATTVIYDTAKKKKKLLLITVYV